VVDQVIAGVQRRDEHTSSPVERCLHRDGAYTARRKVEWESDPIYNPRAPATG
jgi:hypothetical protein